MIRQRCGACRAKLKFADHRVGSTVSCPRCGADVLLGKPEVTVPEPTESAGIVFRSWHDEVQQPADALHASELPESLGADVSVGAGSPEADGLMRREADLELDEVFRRAEAVAREDSRIAETSDKDSSAVVRDEASVTRAPGIASLVSTQPGGVTYTDGAEPDMHTVPTGTRAMTGRVARVVARWKSLAPGTQLLSAAVGGAACAALIFAIAFRDSDDDSWSRMGSEPVATEDATGQPLEYRPEDDPTLTREEREAAVLARFQAEIAANGGIVPGSVPNARIGGEVSDPVAARSRRRSGGAGPAGGKITGDASPRADVPFPANEYHGVARLASQLFYINSKPEPFPSRGFVDRARGVSDPQLKQAAESAWQAALAYEAAVELRGNAAEAQDSAFGKMALSAVAGFDSAAADPYDDAEQRRAAGNRRYARRMAGESLESMGEMIGAGASAEALFRNAAEQQLAAWQKLKPFAEKAASLGASAAGNSARPNDIPAPLTLQIDFARQQDENITQSVLRGLIDDPNRRSGLRLAVFAENSTDRELTNVTLMITFKSPWRTISSDAAMLGGAKVAGTERFNFYFVPRWPAGQKIELDPGFEWGQAAVRRTFDADWSLSSDQLTRTTTAHRFEGNFRRYVTEELELAETRISQQGLWATALETATQIASVLPVGSSFTERTEQLRREAVRVRDNVQSLRRLLVNDARFSGRWVFGKFAEPAAVSCVNAPAAGAENGDFELHLFAPNQPTLFRPLRGRLIFSPHVGVWTVGTTSSVLNRRGDQQKPTGGETLPSFAELLNSNEEQGLSFYINDQTQSLAADAPGGDSLTLIAASASDFSSRYDALLGAAPTQPALLTMQPVEPLPEAVVTAFAGTRADEGNDANPEDVNKSETGGAGTPTNAGTKATEIRRLYAHEKAGLGATGRRVDLVTFDTTGGRAATLVAGSEFRTWNLRTGRALSNVKVNSNGPSAITSDFKLIANAQRTRLGIFNVTSANQATRLDADSSVVSIGGPDDSLLATGGRKGLLLVWNRAGELVLTGPHAAEILTINIADDGRTVWAATRDGRLTEWDVTLQQSGAVLQGFTHHVRQIHPSQDGRFVLTASEVLADGDFSRHQHRHELEVRRVSDGESLWKLTFMHQGDAIAVSPDASRVAVGSVNGPVLIWNLHSGEPEHRLVGHRGRVTSASWSRDSQSLLSGGRDLWMIQWNAP